MSALIPPLPPLYGVLPTHTSRSANLGGQIRTFSAHNTYKLVTSPEGVYNTRGAHGSESRGLQFTTLPVYPPPSSAATYDYYEFNPPSSPNCPHCDAPYLPHKPLKIGFIGPLSSKDQDVYDPNGTTHTLHSTKPSTTADTNYDTSFSIHSFPLPTELPPNSPCTRCRGISVVTPHSFPPLPTTHLTASHLSTCTIIYHLPLRLPPSPLITLQSDALLGIALSYLIPVYLHYPVHQVNDGNAKYTPVDVKKGDGGKRRNDKKREERRRAKEWSDKATEGIEASEEIGAIGFANDEGGDY